MQERELEIQIKKPSEVEFDFNEEKSEKRKLRVYVDYESQKYYIDMSAAFALTLITYHHWIADENGYYEITERLLNELGQIYEIEYEYFDLAPKIDDKEYNDLHNDSDIINPEIKELKELRDELMKKNQYNEVKDYEVSNYVEGPKK